jgi:hypothetical protein
MSTDSVVRSRGFSEPPLSPEAPAVPAVLAQRLVPARPRPQEASVTVSPPPEWIARVTLACVEVAYGRRSLNQLRSVTTRAAIRKLELLQQTRRDFASQNIAVSCGPVRISAPVKDALEVSVTVIVGRKAFPLALRLEHSESRWLICEIEMGPH